MVEALLTHGPHEPFRECQGSKSPVPIDRGLPNQVPKDQ